MNYLAALLLKAAGQVWHTFSVNWPLLALSALVAALLKVYLDQNRAAAFLRRHQGAGIAGAVAVAVATPLCSCGTTAVILGMMANLISWGPVVAFMVASPLTSPQELFYSAGLFGWPFALAFFLASIMLGLAGGLIARTLESQGLLANQARFRPITGGSGEAMADAAPTAAPAAQASWRDVVREFYLVGRRLLAFFLAFAFIGYVLNGLISSQWVSTLFGSGRTFGVPLAATLGLPLYINTEASLPLVRSFMDLGMSPGATLAFLITGAGTSIGAVSGALTIARWRVVGVVVATLWVGSVILGYSYNALLSFGLL